MDKNRTISRTKWIISIVFLLFFLTPFIISIYHSVLSADDFTYVIRDFSLKKCLEDTARRYMIGGGSAPFTFLTLSLNPLNFGKAYDNYVGVFLIGALAVFLVTLYFFVRNVLRYFTVNSALVQMSCYVMLILMIFNSNIYPEIFYWFGGNWYLWAITSILLCILCSLRYFASKISIWRCIGLSIIGFIACFFYQYAVWAGLSYLIVFYRSIKRKSIRNNNYLYYIIPLVFMVIGGCLSVFSPGNFARHDSIDSTGLHIGQAALDALKNTIRCAIDLLKNPMIVGGMIGAFLIGMSQNQNESKINPGRMLLTGFVSIYCVVFPLALGYSNAGIPNRQYFVIDFSMICIGFFSLLNIGKYINSKLRGNIIAIKRKVILVMSIIPLSLAIYGLSNSPWLYTIKNIEAVKKESTFYHDILLDIETADSQEVIITRKKENVSAKTGILKETVNIWDSNDWLNGCVRWWFEKDKLVFIIEE